MTRNRKVVWVSAAAATGLALTGGAVTAGLVWADPADGGGSAKGECEVSVLTEDVYSHANDLSPSGEHVAGATYTEEHAETERTPVYWEMGEKVDISDAVAKAFPDYSGATVEAINDHGVAAGNLGLGDGESYRYQDGEAVELKLPDGVDSTYVQGIAADGTILGLGQTTGGDDIAVTWAPDSDEGTVVETPENVSVADIDDGGNLAGYSQSGEDGYQLWHTVEGKWVEPEGATTDEVEVMTLSGEFLQAGAVKVDLTTGETAEHDVAYPYTIDANGSVYGVDEDGNPVRDAGDGAEKLPSNDTDDNPADPQVVNEDGSVIAGESSSGADEHTSTHAVKWTCGS